MGGKRGEEKWRLDGTGAPEGRLGERRDSHTQEGSTHGEEIGKNRERPSGDRRIGRRQARVSTTHSGPREPAKVPGLTLLTPRSPLAKPSLGPTLHIPTGPFPATRVLRLGPTP